MKNALFEYDFFITNISLAILVKAGTGAKVHTCRPSHGFAYNLAGEKVYRFRDGAVISLKANELIYLPRLSDYTVEDVVPGDCYAINFLLQDAPAAEPFKMRIPPEKILGYFKKAESCFRTRQYGYKEICCRELYGIAVHLKEALCTQPYLSGKQQRILLRAKAFIADRYMEGNISLAELSAHCGVSQVYLRRLFRAECGMSPVAYINSVKLSYAEALLHSGGYTVSDACFLSGFNDVSYFCRAYKRRYGVPPTAHKGRGDPSAEHSP